MTWQAWGFAVAFMVVLAILGFVLWWVYDVFRRMFDNW